MGERFDDLREHRRFHDRAAHGTGRRMFGVFQIYTDYGSLPCLQLCISNAKLQAEYVHVVRSWPGFSHVPFDCGLLNPSSCYPVTLLQAFLQLPLERERSEGCGRD